MGGTVENSTQVQANTASDALMEQNWRRIFSQALRSGATDIHIEPKTESLLVRFRHQGALSTDLTLDINIARPLARQIKQLAQLDLRQTRFPQEGAFNHVHNHHTYHLSVNTMPLLAGERIVIHIHDPLAQPPDLAALGLWGRGLAAVQNALAAPHGLILISGPNHSGVSTTLASCAATLSSPPHRLVSIEDKAAYQVPNVAYMAVRPTTGMTWPRVLRMQLKHEPDVVILGNIPDRETAEITVKAAIKQRLVLGGVRADDAPAAVTQLLRLSGNPLDLAASLRLLCSQRLLPRLCPDCREVFVPDIQLQKQLIKMFRLDLSRNIERLKQLDQEALSQGLGDQLPVDSRPNPDSRGDIKLWRAKPGGCRNCHKNGYRGAIALFEVIAINDDVRSQLAKASASTLLRNSLLAARISSLTVDGLVKALCGLVTIEAVLNL